MSNYMFEKARQAFAAGSLAWATQTFVLMLLKLDGSLTDTAIKAITGVTNANPAVYTVASTAGWSTGDIAVVRGVGGCTSANQLGVLQVINGTTFSLKTPNGDALNIQGNGAYTSGGCVINLTVAQYYADVDGAAPTGAWALSAATAFTTKTNTNGVLDADDVANVPLNDTCHAAIIVRNNANTAASSEVVHFMDGRIQVEVAADAASGATTVWVRPLEGIIPSGTAIVFSNGVTGTLTAQANKDARSLAVSALSGAIPAGHVGEAQSQNSALPLTMSSGQFTHQFDSGSNKILKL